MNPKSKILVLGHNGLVGSALVRRLRKFEYENVLTWDRSGVDLRDLSQVTWAFSVFRPEYVFLAAAKVGGIRGHLLNHAEMLVANLQIQNNVILNAAEYGVRKLLFLGSSCIYPEHASVPTTEDRLLTGSLQPANEGYALAKIAGLKLCQYLKRERGLNFVSAMPCNLYGPGDNFNPETAHVIPGMMARMHAAKEAGQTTFRVWGRPDVKREFLYSDDLADALIEVMRLYDSDEPINTGSGQEMSMLLLAHTMAWVTGFNGELVFSYEDSGTERKLMDNSKLRELDWSPKSWPKTEFCDGLCRTYQDFLTARRK